MAVSTITKGKAAVPGKAKERSVTVLLSGTYTTGGETIKASELGFHRITEITPTLEASNATEATPVGWAFTTVESGVTVKLKLINTKTAAELANGVTVAGVKVKLRISGF